MKTNDKFKNMKKNLSICGEKISTRYCDFEFFKLSDEYGVALTLRDGTKIFQAGHHDELSAVNAVFMAHRILEIFNGDDEDV